MDGLLFLAHRIPFPPNKGDKIRSFHLLRHLSQHYRIFLGAFVDDPDDWQYADALAPYCAEINLLPLHPWRRKLTSLKGLFTGEALTLPYYQHAALSTWSSQLVRQGRVNRGLAFSSAMGQFMPAALSRKVMDMVDVDSDKWTQYAPSQRWPLRWLYAREGRKLAMWEAKMAEQFDATLLVSEPEASLLRQRIPSLRDKIYAFENGVDADYFSPERAYPNPFEAGIRAIVFTGAMDYWPNIDAVSWFAREIFPSIRKECPQAQFVIVGSRPSAEVSHLAQQQGVIVTGAVPDVRPYLAHAACAVAPLRIARGVQNKVLEAMAMSKPVVATSHAAEGIRADAGAHYMLADDIQTFAAAVLAQLTQPRANIAQAARRCVLRHYDWGNNLAAVDALLAPAAKESAFVSGVNKSPLGAQAA